jgi:hypothetical protein
MFHRLAMVPRSQLPQTIRILEKEVAPWIVEDGVAGVVLDLAGQKTFVHLEQTESLAARGHQLS